VSKSPAPTSVHVACIMDGNGRWAKQRGLPRTAGHTAGEEAIRRLVRVAVSRGDVGWLTLFGFSTENWRRPRAEVRHILSLHRKLFGDIDELNGLNVRVRWMGRPFGEAGSRTPLYIQRSIRKAEAATAANTGLTLTIAFDYGSRAELTHAARHALAAGRTDAEAIDAHLYLPDLPPVDVLVRTSGERRLSNFMLWQIAGARALWTQGLWPDIGEAELDAAVALARRSRATPSAR
jgi:undecaprenyl diphosphate synthase